MKIFGSITEKVVSVDASAGRSPSHTPNTVGNASNVNVNRSLETEATLLNVAAVKPIPFL